MLRTKKQEKNGQWFRDQIRAFLLRNGATEQLNRCYEYAISTKMGTLQVSVYPDWVACRFDDVARALAVIGRSGMNPFSGKWNHLFRPVVFPKQGNGKPGRGNFRGRSEPLPPRTRLRVNHEKCNLRGHTIRLCRPGFGRF